MPSNSRKQGVRAGFSAERESVWYRVIHGLTFGQKHFRANTQNSLIHIRIYRAKFENS